MKVQELDVVRLKDGREGTIVEVFSGGSAYMVEFCDGKGRTIDLPVVKYTDIEKVIYSVG